MVVNEAKEINKKCLEVKIIFQENEKNTTISRTRLQLSRIIRTRLNPKKRGKGNGFPLQI